MFLQLADLIVADGPSGSMKKLSDSAFKILLVLGTDPGQGVCQPVDDSDIGETAARHSGEIELFCSRNHSSAACQ